MNYLEQIPLNKLIPCLMSYLNRNDYYITDYIIYASRIIYVSRIAGIIDAIDDIILFIDNKINEVLHGVRSKYE